MPLAGCTFSVSIYEACKIVFQEKLQSITGECFQHGCQNCGKGSFAQETVGEKTGSSSVATECSISFENCSRNA